MESRAPTAGHDAPPARRLLDAAIRAIDAGGETALRVQDIADAAGVQIPILYRHFGSRDGLLEAAHTERLRMALDREMQEIQAAVDRVTTAEQFSGLIDAILATLASPERRAARWKRANVIGSTYGRPATADAVAELHSKLIHGIAGALSRPQQLGWVRAELDLLAFAAWFAGQTLGRILIELGDSGVEDAAWDSVSADAVRHVLLAPDQR